jgi:hypothetical protein
MPGDGPHHSTWIMAHMWDGIVGQDNGYSSVDQGNWPQSLTIDMGVTARISRIRIFQRIGRYTYSEGNLRNFEVWGCTDPLDMSGSWNNWTQLMTCESIKPSGLPLGQNSDEDVTRATEGEDFVNSPDNPAVRYLRIKVSRTWSGGHNFQISELEIYGDNREN